jgi:hypothetical protein
MTIAQNLANSWTGENSKQHYDQLEEKRSNALKELEKGVQDL